MKNLTEQEKWGELLETASSALIGDKFPEYYFFKGLAELRLGFQNAADLSIQEGLNIDPASRWGMFLLVELADRRNDTSRGVELLNNWLQNDPSDKEVLTQLINKLESCGRFREAKKIHNRLYRIFRADSEKYAVVIQSFIKTETLETLFKSLLQTVTDRELDVIIVQDSILGSERFGGSATEWEAVSALISRYTGRLAERFGAVRLLNTDFNFGTTITNVQALNYVSSRYKGFIFFEDDCVLAPTALDWIAAALDNYIDISDAWFVSGESVFFDSKTVMPSETQIDAFREFVRDKELHQYFTMVDYVPSTCFATLSGLWRLCGSLRGLPLGDHALTNYLRASKRKTIMPIVPMVKDVGMLDPNGFSVRIHGMEGVLENKCVYLMSEADDVETQIPYPDDINLLYSATALLNEDSIMKLIARQDKGPNSG